MNPNTRAYLVFHGPYIDRSRDKGKTHIIDPATSHPGTPALFGVGL